MNNTSVLGISLSQGIKPGHLYAYLIVALVSSGYAGAMAVMQPGLLQVMGIPQDQQATLTGNLSAMQELVFIVALGLYGVVSDRMGRKPVYVFGLLTTAMGFFLYPTASDITELVFYRLFVAVGSAAMVGMMVTVIADYSVNETRGKANGVQGFVATIGAFIPPILGALPQQFVGAGYSEQLAQQFTFAIAGSLGVFAAAVAWIGLAPMATRAIENAGESMWAMLAKGAAAARNPGIALSYGASFISRGDLAVTGAFMGLWLVQHGVSELGLSPSEATGQLAVPAILTVVTGALLGSVMMGFIADKISRVAAVTFAPGLAALVYLGVFLIGDPTAPWVKVLLFVMGVAEISAFVSSQALVGEQAESDRRGAIMGFFGVAGAVGILIGTSGGGYLYAHLGPSAPFVLFGLLNSVVFLWSIAIANKVPVPDFREQSA